MHSSPVGSDSFMELGTPLYIVFDRKAGAVLGPVCPFRSDGEAQRWFRGLVADKETLPGQYPNDFLLVAVGALQPRTGLLVIQAADGVAVGLSNIIATGRDVAEELAGG